MPAAIFKPGLSGATLDEALETCGESPPVLIDQLISDNSTVMLSGDGDTGKSIISLCVAAAASSGLPVWGQFDCRTPLKIYYLVGERNARESLIRLRQMRAKLPLNKENFSINGSLVGTIDLSSDIYVASFIDFLKKDWPGLQLLFLEPIYAMVPVWDERHVLALVRNLTLIKAQLNCAVWLTHHNTKSIVSTWGSEKQRANAYYGPVWLYNHVEGQYSVTKTGDNTRKLTMQKDTNRIMLSEIPLVYDSSTCTVEMDPNDLLAPLKVRDRMYVFLRRCENENRGFTLNEIMLQTCVSRATFFRICDRPPWNGRISNTNAPGKEAFYTIAPR